MPKIPLDDPRYVTNLSVKSNDRNLISRNEGGNLIQVTGELLYIETPTYIYDNTAINNVLKTNFEYYKFPSRIVVVDDVDLGIIPIEELNIEIPDEPIKIRYRLNQQEVPTVLTVEEVNEQVKTKDTNNRFIYNDNTWTFESRIEGSFKELDFGTVLEGMPQTLANRFTVTQDIIDRNVDLTFNINIALRMTDNYGRNNYAARLLRYNPDTNKYAVLAQKTSVSPLSAQYSLYIERNKQLELQNLQTKFEPVRNGMYNMLVDIVEMMIKFVSINEKDAQGVQVKDLTGMFNYVNKPGVVPKNSLYNNGTSYNFWKGNIDNIDYWFSKANSCTYKTEPLEISMIIAAGLTRFKNDQKVQQKINDLKNILIEYYLYQPYQIENLISKYHHYIYSFTEMWAMVNNSSRPLDSDKTEFDEYYKKTDQELKEAIWPNRASNNNITDLTNVNIDNINYRYGGIYTTSWNVVYGGITNDNYTTEPFRWLNRISTAIRRIEQKIRIEYDKISKKWDELDRNFIPRNELIDPVIYERNLETDVINAASSMKSAEKFWINYVVESVNLNNKLLGTTYEIPTTYESATTIMSTILKTNNPNFSKLSESDKNILRNQFNRNKIDSIRSKPDREKIKYTEAQRKLKQYQSFNNADSLKLTELLTDGVDNKNSKLGYLWSRDLPYIISISEIIPKSQLKLHDSYAVELVASKHYSIPHELIEDQTYWKIEELQNTKTINESNINNQISSIVNTPISTNFNSNIGSKPIDDIPNNNTSD